MRANGRWDLIRHLKVKVTEKEEIQIRKFILHFSVFHCTSHQPISVADLG
jgi:hypothetical protein